MALHLSDGLCGWGVPSAGAGGYPSDVATQLTTNDPVTDKPSGAGSTSSAPGVFAESARDAWTQAFRAELARSRKSWADRAFAKALAEQEWAAHAGEDPVQVAQAWLARQPATR